VKSINGTTLRNYVGLTIIMLIPAFVIAQHKNTPAPNAQHSSAPARPANAPAHTSAPSRSGGNTQHTMTRPTNGAAGHGTTTAHGTTNSGHGTTTAAHATTNSAHGTTNTAHGTTNTGHGTTNAGHGTTNTGHGTTNAGHGTVSAGRGTVAGGRSNLSRPAPGRQVSLKGGGTASIRPNGQIRSVNRNGMQIQHNLHGGRTIVAEHNGARVVTMGRRGGYVQRSYVTRGGRNYYSRTYYSHGVYRTGIYRGYYWGGHPYYGYYPGFYYHPGYYGWAYNPWPAPVYYGWGWGGAPWYGYYGGYFAPYPVYPSAAFWLTDYLIAANLRASYEAQAEANAEANAPPSDQLQASTAPSAPSSGTVALSPEVKQAIAEEVKAQLAEERAQAGNAGSSQAQPGGASGASNEVPPALDPARRTFVVSADLSVVSGDGECALTPGDVITRLTDKPDSDNKVNVSVSASKKTDCAPGKLVAVSVDDLQEMQNHFQEQLTSGMGELAKKQGKDGLPKAPDTSTVAGDVPEPPPDKTAAKTLEDQEKTADQTESEVKQEAASSGGSSQ
jgi:hypothetical protein